MTRTLHPLAPTTPSPSLQMPLQDALAAPDGARFQADQLGRLRHLEALLAQRQRHGLTPVDYADLQAVQRAVQTAQRLLAELPTAAAAALSPAGLVQGPAQSSPPLSTQPGATEWPHPPAP